MPMQTQGNVQTASEEQFDETRICLEKSFNKLRGRLTHGTAQQWIGDSGTLDRLVEGMLQYQPRYEVRDSVIYFTLTSNGKTGAEWETHLERRSFRFSKYAKDVLRSEEFKPTPAGTIHRVAVLKGELFSEENRITKQIRAEAERRKLNTPHPEIGPLFKDTFSDADIERMGLNWVMVMHCPIKDSGGVASLLDAGRGVGHWLSAARSDPEGWWSREDGFAFSVPQESLASVTMP